MLADGVIPSLIRTESGGNWRAKNDARGAGGKKGHFGRLQFGQARLEDATRAGVLPVGTTPEAFMADPELQKAVEQWHFAEIDDAIQKSGYDKLVGQQINGVPITVNGLRAVAHLGGIDGMKKFVSSGGTYDPSDVNGTSLTDYLKTHGVEQPKQSGLAAISAAINEQSEPPVKAVMAFADQVPDDVLNAFMGDAPPARERKPGVFVPSWLADDGEPEKIVDDAALDAFMMRAPETATQNPGLFVNNAEPTVEQTVTGARSDSWMDVLGQLGMGGMRGVKDVLDTGAEGLAFLADAAASRVAPQSVADAIASSRNKLIADNAAEREAFERQYGDRMAADVGQVLGQIAGTAPLVFSAPVGAAARVGAEIGNKLLSPIGAGRAGAFLGGAAGAGAAGGAAFEAGTASTDDRPVLEQAAEGAATGAVLGPAFATGLRAGSKLVQAAIPSTNPISARLAEEAAQLGIPLRPSQVAEAPWIKKLDETSAQLPFNFKGSITPDKQMAAFSKALSKQFGESTEVLTDDVFDRAAARIGKDLDKAAKDLPIKIDPQFASDVQDVMARAEQMLTDQQLGPVKRMLVDILRKASQTGEIDGTVYQNITSRGGGGSRPGPLAAMQKSGDAATRMTANMIRDALEDAMERSAQASGKVDSLKVLRDARYQWKAMRIAQEMTERTGTGEIAPQKLMAALVRSPGGRQSAPELDLLARIGQKFFTPQRDSGTPLGLFTTSMITNPFATLLGAAPGMVTSAVRSGTLNRDYLRRAIIEKGLGRSKPENRLLGGASRNLSVVPSSGDNDRLQVTVTPQSVGLRPAL